MKWSMYVQPTFFFHGSRAHDCRLSHHTTDTQTVCSSWQHNTARLEPWCVPKSLSTLILFVESSKRFRLALIHNIEHYRANSRPHSFTLACIWHHHCFHDSSQLWVAQDDVESQPALPTYVVKHLFGTRDDVMLDVCGRQLIEKLAALEVCRLQLAWHFAPSHS